LQLVEYLVVALSESHLAATRTIPLISNPFLYSEQAEKCDAALVVGSTSFTSVFVQQPSVPASQQPKGCLRLRLFLMFLQALLHFLVTLRF
jgi:hypothetical protein